MGSPIPDELIGVGIEENLGAQIPLSSLQFKDEAGVLTPFSSYFNQGRPVILSMIYFDCPNLCNFLLNGAVDGMKSLQQFQLGKQYDFVSVSIDPKETPEIAAKKKAAYLQALGHPEAASHCHFLTGTQDQIELLAKSIGFRYRWHEPSKQYAHGAGLFLLTPDGKVSRVLHGVTFRDRDLKLGLLEASDGKIGTVVDRIVMFCFQYSTAQRGYIPYIFRFVQIISFMTTVLVMTVIGRFWWREKSRVRKGAISSC